MTATDLSRPGPSVPPATTGQTPIRSVAGRRLHEVLLASWPYAVVAVVTFAVALWTYRPWRLGSALAFPSGDSTAFAAWIKAVSEGGWYETNDLLGAPYGQNSHGYPVTDELTMAVVGKVLAPLTGSVGASITWWVLLSFPLAAILAVAFARQMGVGRLAAVVPGVAFALLPDHFFRATGHYSLAATWAIPLGMILAMGLLVPAKGWWGRHRAFAEAAAAAGCVVVALTNIYYALFTAIFVGVVALGAAVARRSWVPIGLGFVRGLAITAPISVFLLLDRAGQPVPSGYAAVEVTRTLADAEAWGGKIFAMLLPSPFHRLEQFAAIRADYDRTFPFSAESPALGVVAALGFVTIVVWSIIRLWSRASENAAPTLGYLAGALWVALLLYTLGGLGSAVSILSGGGLRVWSRVHEIIALLGLVAVAWALDRVRRKWLRAGLVAAVTAVVLFDQTSPKYMPPFDHAVELDEELSDFSARVADEAGSRGSVFQLPVMTFPIVLGAVGGVGAYDGALPYVYAPSSVRWSWGALMGNPQADWQISLSRRPVPQMLGSLASAGFKGVSVDAQGIVDEALLPELKRLLGDPVIVSSSGRWLYFPLATPPCETSAVQELADAAIAPPLVYPGNGFHADYLYWVAGQAAAFDMLTLRERGWASATIRLALSVPAGTEIQVQFPDEHREVLSQASPYALWTGPFSGEGGGVHFTRISGVDDFRIIDYDAAPTLSPAAMTCVAALETTP